MSEKSQINEYSDICESCMLEFSVSKDMNQNS